MTVDKLKRWIANGVVLVGSILLAVSILMFVIMNEGVFFSSTAMGIFLLLPIVMILVGYIIISKTKPMENRQSKWRAWIDIVIAVVVLVVCIMLSLVVDFVQPLVLNSMTNILMVVGSIMLVVGAVLEIIADRGRFASVVASSLIVVMFVGILWANLEGYKPFNTEIVTEQTRVFENGEDDYTTFRIPSIIAIDREVINREKGGNLKHDVLLATAEGRKNSSHDTGSIDLVAKTSVDGGKTWSDLKVLYSYADKVGKYGNPTPVFDSVRCNVIFPYMTRINGETVGYDTYVAVCPIDKDGNITFTPTSEHVDISFDKVSGESNSSDGVSRETLMVGPGKSIQLRSGRIVVPASSGGKSFVMYCDGNPLVKENWQRGGNAGDGNECEVVELIDSTLVMVLRANTGCCDNHFEQYQRLAYSYDGGLSWQKQATQTKLRTPICMASIDRLSNNAMLLTYPDSFYTRVNLSISSSLDDGASFKTQSLYSGPAGYSCVAVDSDDNVFVLAEIGKVNYNEELILLKINGNKLY